MKTLSRTAFVSAVLVAVAAVPAAAQPHHHAAPAAAPRSDSVYELSASLVDQDGRTVGLDLYRGHPVLISMFYTTCRGACPLLIADLKRIERGLPAPTRADLRVVLISFDPEHDTPEALRALAQAHGLDSSRWRLLRAPDDTVREIAAVLGIRYRRLPDGGFNHSTLITLLAPSGVILARVEGLGQPIDAVREGLRAER
jgi:protein SCO1/2